MAKHTLAKNIDKYLNETVTLKGWVYNIRKSGKIWFLIFRDGTEFIQCVILKNEVSPEVFELKTTLTQESSVTITGVVQKASNQKFGYEILVKDMKVIQIAEEYPISLKEHGIEFLLDNRHLWLRSKLPNAILKIRHEVSKASRNFFDERDFTLIDSPMFTPNASEGTTTLFKTKYFDQEAYLTQSGQLYSEAAIMGFNKTYCFGPIFRAEKSKTRRHLTEFWMIEPEMAFYDINDNMKLAEEYVSYIIQQVLKNRKKELEILGRNVTKLKKIKPPFPRITYDEAVKILQQNGRDFKWGDDFGAPDETLIAKDFDKPVMIHRWPAKTKPFYMKRDENDDKYVLGMDMIAPEGHGEIIGGSQREDNLDLLLKRIKNENLSKEMYNWYLDLRKYGSIPHSGFGLGLERTVGWICGIKHIREAIPFPRTMIRLAP
ncbi:MAG: asparagine--tRNA ligase [Candidatus Marinimicrobia bacterium]|nr:asparagine--tRNA ligase [Candidatus Neomarinimicrobiota bacterium]